MLVTYPVIIPIAMVGPMREVKLPRMCLGAISAMYTGPAM